MVPSITVKGTEMQSRTFLAALLLISPVFGQAIDSSGRRADGHHHHPSRGTSADAPAAVENDSVPPLDAPSYGHHHADALRNDAPSEWDLSAHGSVFIRYLRHDGPRAYEEWSIPNWVMTDARYHVNGRTQVIGRAMFSLDRVTDGGEGYPLLFQSGETWNRRRLVDRQHPHDLISELSLAVRHETGNGVALMFSAGYPGAPALGPEPFMHRPSAAMNPDAPIGHHWQDATHISFGVVTAALLFRDWSLEGSWFNGREPDEDRFRFDRLKLDSYSGRLTVRPMTGSVFQISSGRLHDPEGHDETVDRLTASFQQSNGRNHDAPFTLTIIWGRNTAHGSVLDSYLAELSYRLRDAGLYSRHEWVEKSRAEFGISSESSVTERVRQHSVGLRHRIGSAGPLRVDGGVQATLSIAGPFLRERYGAAPLGVQIYLHVQ
ncbi:MAG: hypothetical protein F9K22_09150 [Bacteroidetes bacterium]|nr:MAG: hypothetical protein F9K22_09150 [Bacteroidota bacterium]